MDTYLKLRLRSHLKAALRHYQMMRGKWPKDSVEYDTLYGSAISDAEDILKLLEDPPSTPSTPSPPRTP